MKNLSKTVSAALLASACGLAQAGQQYHIHEIFSGGEHFDGLVTFSADFDKITAVNGTLTTPWLTSQAVDGVWASTYVTYGPGIKGVSLTGPDGFPGGYVLDFSWNFKSAPSIGVPVFVTDSWYDDNTGWNYFYNNSINGYNYVTSVTINAVPEPEAYAMLLAGFGILGWAAYRRKSA